MSTASLRRVRNKEQMAERYFTDDGRMLNNSNVARKVRINDDGKNSVTMTQVLQGQLGSQGCCLPSPPPAGGTYLTSVPQPRLYCSLALGEDPSQSTISRVPGPGHLLFDGGFLIVLS